MARSDLVVIWGTNAVVTQVNVMTHAARARKERGARIVAVDVYENGTMKQADWPVCIRRGPTVRSPARYAYVCSATTGRTGIIWRALTPMIRAGSRSIC